MASLLLASRVITMMPVPMSGTSAGDVRSAVAETPAYLKFMDSWRWSLDLWRDGAIVSTHQGEDAADEMAAVCEKIDRDQHYLPLRPMLRRSLFDDDRSYLRALANDLLRGGPDPGISVPVAAALDRFSTRHAIAVARSAPVSIAQRAEAQLGRRVIGTAVPVLIQADGSAILRARELLESSLTDLRRVMGSMVQDFNASDSAWTPGNLASGELNSAASEYTEQFSRLREDLLDCDQDDVRCVEGTVAISVVVLPGDAVLRSSLTALKTAAGISPRSGSSSPRAATKGMVLSDPADARPVLSLVIRAMGR